MSFINQRKDLEIIYIILGSDLNLVHLFKKMEYKVKIVL